MHYSNGNNISVLISKVNIAQAIGIIYNNLITSILQLCYYSPEFAASKR